MKELIIVGASGFGREVLQWVKDANAVHGEWRIKGFIDDNLGALDGVECDKSVLGTIRDWKVEDNEVFVCAVALPKVKKEIVEWLLQRNATFVNLVHPTAIIGSHGEIGQGLIVTPFAKVSPNVKMGNFVTLLGSSVGHDAQLSDFCTVSGNCSVNGHVIVGEGAFIASNACIAPKKKVGAWSYVGMGSMVISNVRINTKVMGNPARRINI